MKSLSASHDMFLGFNILQGHERDWCVLNKAINFNVPSLCVILTTLLLIRSVFITRWTERKKKVAFHLYRHGTVDKARTYNFVVLFRFLILFLDCVINRISQWLKIYISFHAHAFVFFGLGSSIVSWNLRAPAPEPSSGSNMILIKRFVHK